MNNEIIINIDEANKAKKYDKDGLFQIDAFERVTKILKQHSYDDKNVDEIVNCRFHDTIFIDGHRGVGKTAFMLNIKNYYEDKKAEKKYLFLDPVDPTLLEHTEKFLSVVLARVVEKVNDKAQKNEIQTSDSYFDSLEQLSKSLSAVKTLPDDIGIEEIASNKSSLKLEQNAHNFFKEVSNLFNVKGLVMLIDDIDMAFDKGFDVLEVVRKYLASPYLIPIVAGDMNLYKEIIETQFMSKIRFNDDMNHLKAIYGADKIKESDEYKAKKQLLDNLVEQYLHKIFPSEYHIQLKDIFKILKENDVLIKLNDKLTISYIDLKDFEIRLINYGINQKEFTHQVFTNNTRDFVQYLYNKKEIFVHAFEDNKYLAVDETKDHFIVSNRFDDLIKEQFLEKQDKHKESLQLTANFYRYSNDEDKKRLSLLLDNDVASFTDKGYSIYKALKGDFFTNQTKPFNKIDKEKIRDNLYLPKKRFSSALKELEESINNDFTLEYFLIKLMLHSNYYANVKTKNLFTTGKFIEYIFYILDKNFTDEIIITEPIFSEINTNRYIKNITQEDDEEENVVYKDKFNKDSDVAKYLQSNNDSIPFISSVFINEMMNKYINNLNIYKIGNHKEYQNYDEQFKNEVNEIYGQNSFFDSVKRVIYILLNSIGSFESSSLVSSENIAQASKIDNIKKSRTFKKNVQELKEGTLTNTLYKAFKYILEKSDYENDLFAIPVLSKSEEQLLIKEFKLLGYPEKGINFSTRESIMKKLIEGINEDKYTNLIINIISKSKFFKDKFVNFNGTAKGFDKDKYQELVKKLQTTIENKLNNA